MSAPSDPAVARRLSNDEFLAIVRPMFDAGRSWREMAERTGYTISGARTRAAFLGLRAGDKAPAPRDNAKIKLAELDRLAEMVNASTAKQVAWDYGVSPATVCRALHRGGYRQQWVRA